MTAKERQRRAQQRSRVPDRLLYSREEVGHILGGISTAQVKRLEAQGLLTGRRLNQRAANAQVFYPAEQVIALAKGDTDAA